MLVVLMVIYTHRLQLLGIENMRARCGGVPDVWYKLREGRALVTQRSTMRHMKKISCPFSTERGQRTRVGGKKNLNDSSLFRGYFVSMRRQSLGFPSDCRFELGAYETNIRTYLGEF